MVDISSDTNRNIGLDKNEVVEERIVIKKRRREEPHIRIQKSKNGMFVMFVLVWWTTKDNVKHKHTQYYSLPFYVVHAYINGLTNTFYITAEKMMSKDDPRYAEYIAYKKKKLEARMAKTKERQEKRALTANQAKQMSKDFDLKSSNDPSTLKMPFKTGMK